MYNFLEDHLKNKIVPFWNRQVDFEHGGYYGYAGLDLVSNKHADKGAVKLARILWSYSALYNHFHEESFLEHAKIAYEYLINVLYDHKNKGVYWKSSYKGIIINDSKHIYAQSFAIYGLSEYYKATKIRQVLVYAMEIYNTIEARAYQTDSNSYFEQFDKEWKKTKNTLLSAENIIPSITTNSILHLLESYTLLFEITQHQKVFISLNRLIDIFYTKVYDKQNHRCRVFFDKNWNSISTTVSYGHDIEASWLLDKALDQVNLQTNEYSEMTKALCNHVFLEAYSEGMLISDIKAETVNDSLIWWVQAEAVIGFINHFQKTKEQVFLTAAKKTLEVTMEKLVDKHTEGEWFWAVDRNGNPQEDYGISENWKANYHNVRMCLEILKRRQLD